MAKYFFKNNTNPLYRSATVDSEYIDEAYFGQSCEILEEEGEFYKVHTDYNYEGYTKKENVVEADYVGIVSANKVQDKIARCGWTAVRSEKVTAPIFSQLPFALECEVISYDTESCRLVGRIVDISVDEDIMTDGKIDLRKFNPICYDPSNHTYLTLGEVVGHAFSDGKKFF